MLAGRVLHGLGSESLVSFQSAVLVSILYLLEQNICLLRISDVDTDTLVRWQGTGRCVWSQRRMLQTGQVSTHPGIVTRMWSDVGVFFQFGCFLAVSLAAVRLGHVSRHLVHCSFLQLMGI
jgi:hypothetical protein